MGGRYLIIIVSLFNEVIVLLNITIQWSNKYAIKWESPTDSGLMYNERTTLALATRVVINSYLCSGLHP